MTLVSLLALVTGYVIDLIVGDPRSIPHPVVWIGKLISFCEKQFRHIFPKTKRGELAAGVCMVCTVLLVSTAIPALLLWLCGMVSVQLRFAAESIMCWQILATKSLKDESMKVHASLQKGDIEEARYNVSMIVGRDTERLDEAGITRAAVETVAENTSDGIVAPMLFAALGGAAFGFFYKAINTMDSMTGYKNDRYLYFGRVAARLDDAANFIPSRLSALLMIVSSFLLRYDAKNALRIFRRDRYKHASPNSAQTESVCAGALGIRLAGDAYYGGILHKKEYIGDPTRAVVYDDIRKANRLLYMTSALSLLVFGLLKACVIVLVM